MTSCQPPLFLEQRYLPDIGKVVVASVTAIAGVGWPAIVDAADEDENPAQTRFLEAVPWLPREFLPAGKPIAFEEHAHFVYLAGRSSPSQEPSQFDDQDESWVRLVFLRPATLVVDVWPLDAKHGNIGRPTAMSTVQVRLASGKTTKRAVYVYHSPEQEATRRTVSVRSEND